MQEKSKSENNENDNKLNDSNNVNCNKNEKIIPNFKEEKLLFKSKFLSLYQQTFIIKKDNSKDIVVPYDVVEYNSKRKENNSSFSYEDKYGIYGTSIIPIIKYPKSKKKPKIILISNFRYPLKRYCLELPGGFIDKSDFKVENGNILDDETIHKAIIKGALRELKEETGYTGKFISYGSKFIFNDFNFPINNQNDNKQENNRNNNNNNNNNNNDNNNDISQSSLLSSEAVVFSDPWKSSDNGANCIIEIDGDSEIKGKTNPDFDELIMVHEVEISELGKFVKEQILNGSAIAKNLYSLVLGMSIGKWLSE